MPENFKPSISGFPPSGKIRESRGDIYFSGKSGIDFLGERILRAGGQGAYPGNKGSAMGN